MMKFNPVRDVSASLVGLIGGVGLLGVAAKKLLISADSSFTKRFLVGLGAMVVTGGFALVPYLLATPGRATKAELAAARDAVVNNRYNG